MTSGEEVHSTGGSPTLWECDPVRYQANVRPNRPALMDAATGATQTYGELDARVARVASALRAQTGGLKGARVAVLGRNSVAQVVAAMACQRIGAAFVPLNWRLSPAELGVLVVDAEPALLLHDAAGGEAAQLAGGAVPRLSFDELERHAAQAEAAVPDPAPADAPCIILYTSGTTGRPKGAVITGRTAWCQAANMAAVGEIGPGSTLLCDPPLFHTVGLVAVTRTTLTVGGMLAMSPRFDAAATLSRLSDPGLGVSHYFCVPQMAAMLREHPAYGGADFSRLAAMFIGGAPLPPSLIEAFAADGVTLVNGFGMTEAGTVLHMPLDPAFSRRHPGAVGFPAPLMSVRLVGADMQEAAPGASGELWLRGPAVAEGYWRQSEATAAAFTPDGWFRTGDVARTEPGGVYRLLDRAKNMYVSGGENVYPAEVEAVLLSHPDVLEAAVIGAPHPRWGECGVAFLVLRPGATLDAAGVAAHCDGRLARYKQPAHLRVVEALERTASGKVRRDRLQASLADPLAELADASVSTPPDQRNSIY